MEQVEDKLGRMFEVYDDYLMLNLGVQADNDADGSAVAEDEANNHIVTTIIDS